jgi:hypothetical protein
LLDWSAYGFDEFGEQLDTRALWATGQLYAITGRTMASITLAEEVAIAQQVLLAFTVIGAQGGSAAAIAVAEAPWLKSFTAGSYSETRFGPTELAGAKAGSAPYPEPIWSLLWALMTPEKQDDWRVRLGMAAAPAGVFIGMDWGGHDHYGPSIWGPGIDNGWC